MLRGFLSQSTAQRRDIILGESTSRTILFLAVPTLMLGVVQSMMPLMDGLFINNVAGTLVASAVTFSEPVVNMMTSFAMGLSVAAMAILGQLNGRGSFAESKRTATQIVVSGSILGLLSAPLSPGRGSPDLALGQRGDSAQRLPLPRPVRDRPALLLHGVDLQRHQER